ncbi:hypothetical protein G6F68_014035 [Rhizopus microsporus]|nr:hypothetical protein G6F68_014035 [Rhizopus microsporus]
MATLATTIKRDLSGMQKFLFIGAVVILIAALANIFLQLPALMLTISVMAILVFSAFMLVDLQRVVNGGETNYVSATLAIYLDVYNVFSNLLMLLGIFGGNREPFFFGAPLVMHDRRRFLQTAACAALLGSTGTARALSVKQAMLSRAIPASGDSIPVIGLGTADTFNVSPGDTAAMEPLAQVPKRLSARCWPGTVACVTGISWRPRSAPTAANPP